MSLVTRAQVASRANWVRNARSGRPRTTPIGRAYGSSKRGATDKDGTSTWRPEWKSS